MWGPGDNGLDELLCQFDRDGTPWWVLQDAGGDVAALCETPNTSAATVVAAQWTWDAYGNVISAEHLRAHAVLAVGHKGLFADRLDVGVAEAATPGQTISPTGPPRT